MIQQRHLVPTTAAIKHQQFNYGLYPTHTQQQKKNSPPEICQNYLTGRHCFVSNCIAKLLGFPIVGLPSRLATMQLWKYLVPGCIVVATAASMIATMWARNHLQNAAGHSLSHG